MVSLRYLIASLALGAITVWGSENLFWFAPPADLTLGGWVMTWTAYALCAGATLSALLWAGLGGWRGVFLGGILFGYLIEGVVVDTIYDDFPVQLVWTAMAWHGLFTGLVLVGGLRAAPHWPLLRHLALLAGITAFAITFALFWPIERADLPPANSVLFYLAGVGVIVPLAHIVLDRIGLLARPPAIVLWILPLSAAVIWIAKTVSAPDPVRLAFPVVVGLTLWAMVRLGGAATVDPGPRVPVWRHALFLLVPLVAVVITVPVWEAGVQFPGHWVIFAVTVPLSFGLWLWCLWQAARGPGRIRPAP